MSARARIGPSRSFSSAMPTSGLSAGAIGGQYASANRALQFDNLRLRTPLLAPRHAAPLAISFNGQQYTSPLHFSYYRPPVLSAALPASGPTAGGTLGAPGTIPSTMRRTMARGPFSHVSR